jgi:hypothetical protein
MTLVSDIIKAAYRESNIIPLGASPSSNQSTEALNRLNTLILSSVGFEAGDELVDINYGGDYSQSQYINEWVPDNIRLVFNLDSEVTLNIDPQPYDGQRLAFVDAGGNLATYNVTLDGNGRNIEGTSTVTLSTNGDSRQWMYRADTGNWVKIESLDTTDEMPFPQELDDYFITALAVRLNPRSGLAIPGESFEALKRYRTILRTRYRHRKYYTPTDPGLVRPEEDNYGGSNTAFNYGRYWPGFR